MFNESLKTKFVQEYTKSINTANVCGSIFNSMEKYEIEWNSDLCTKSAEELTPAVEDIIGFRARSKWMRLIILKDYVKWCLVSKVPGACDGMLSVNPTGLDKIRQQTVSNPAHLESYLNEICEPTDEQTTDNIYRCYYWLTYAGIREEDIFNIKCTDVDFSKMVIRYKDFEVPLYREALPAFKNCVTLTRFQYKHPNYSDGKKIWKDRVDGDTLIRGVRSSPSLKGMRVELSRRSKKYRDNGSTELKLSYYRVWISGVFYRMYEREQIGITPDFEHIVNQQCEGKTYKLDSGRNTIESKKRQWARDYLEDYQRWKLAYKI